MRIIVFTRNGTNPKFPNRPGLDCKHIRFDTNNLDELLTLAKFRIVNFPTSLILDKRGKILLKVKGSIPNTYIDRLAIA